MVQLPPMALPLCLNISLVRKLFISAKVAKLSVAQKNRISMNRKNVSKIFIATLIFICRVLFLPFAIIVGTIKLRKYRKQLKKSSYEQQYRFDKIPKPSVFRSELD